MNASVSETKIWLKVKFKSDY